MTVCCILLMSDSPSHRQLKVFGWSQRQLSECCHWCGRWWKSWCDDLNVLRTKTMEGRDCESRLNDCSYRGRLSAPSNATVPRFNGQFRFCIATHTFLYPTLSIRIYKTFLTFSQFITALADCVQYNNSAMRWEYKYAATEIERLLEREGILTGIPDKIFKMWRAHNRLDSSLHFTLQEYNTPRSILHWSFTFRRKRTTSIFSSGSDPSNLSHLALLLIAKHDEPRYCECNIHHTLMRCEELVSWLSSYSLRSHQNARYQSNVCGMMKIRELLLLLMLMLLLMRLNFLTKIHSSSEWSEVQ